MFYAIIFLTRYTDIFQENIIWNLLFKLFYIFSSFYIIFLMQYKYSRTRELELSWKLGAVVFVGSFLLTPFVYWISMYSVHSYAGGFSSVSLLFAALPCSVHTHANPVSSFGTFHKSSSPSAFSLSFSCFARPTSPPLSTHTTWLPSAATVRSTC